MIVRAWFALSVLWACLMLVLLCNPEANEGGREGLAIFAAAPFAFGWGLRLLVRYVFTGRLTAGSAYVQYRRH